MNSLQKAMPAGRQGFAPIIIIIILIAALGLGGTWFLYKEKQSLAAEKNDLQSKLADRNSNIDKLKNEKTGIEREIAVLKATNFEKEAELLRLKLKDIETDLASTRGKATTLEATATKIKLYADVMAAIDQNLAPPFPLSLYSNLKSIDDKVSALNDAQVTDQWKQAKSAFDTGGDGGRDLIQTLFLLVSKIRGII